MTSGGAGRATPRWWAAAALAALALLGAGLVQVVAGSRGQLLQLLVGTVLSVAVMAATAWWAFTTRRRWKRWLNIAIATLAVANVVLGFLEFGFRQAAGAVRHRHRRPGLRHRDPPASARRSPVDIRSAPVLAGWVSAPPPGDPTAAGRVPARP